MFTCLVVYPHNHYTSEVTGVAELGIQAGLGTTAVNELINDVIPDGSPYTIISPEDYPNDCGFRDAWVWSNTSPIGIGIHTETAKAIQRRRFRISRSGRLGKLDVDFVRALETGADTSAIVAEKQELRDVTKLVTDLVITETTVAGICSQIDATWDRDKWGSPLINL